METDFITFECREPRCKFKGSRSDFRAHLRTVHKLKADKDAIQKTCMTNGIMRKNRKGLRGKATYSRIVSTVM